MSGLHRVIEAWRRSYDPALAVAAGQCLTVERRDTEWPGWLWCRDESGLGGWLPEEVLEVGMGMARVGEDFDTAELAVVPGEIVEGLGTREGWIWCRADSGAEGWVPLKVLEPL